MTGQQVLGVAGERGAAAGPPDRLRDPAGGAGGQHRPAPDDRVGVGQRDGEHLGRVDRQVAVAASRRSRRRRAPRRPARRRRAGRASTRSRYSSITTAVASWSRVEVGSTVAPPARGVLGDQSSRAGRPRRPGSRGVPPRRPRTALPVSAPVGRQHHHQVEAPGPARAAPAPGQATNGTGHQGSSTARSSRESGPAAITARGRACCSASGPPPRRWPRRRRPTSRRTRAPASASARSRPSARSRAASSSSRDSSNQVDHRGTSGRLAGLVDEQHRDVVADRVGQAAAGQTSSSPSTVERRRGRLGQTMISSRAGSRFIVVPPDQGEHVVADARPWSARRVPSALSRSSGSVLDGRTLNHQSAWLTVRPSSRSSVTPSCPAYAASISAEHRLPGRRPWS